MLMLVAAAERVWTKPVSQSAVNIDPVLLLGVREMRHPGKILRGKLDELSPHILSGSCEVRRS
jgi:hypothetical protein